MDTTQTELYVVEVAASDEIASLVPSVADALDTERRNEGEVSECLVSQTREQQMLRLFAKRTDGGKKDEKDGRAV